MPTETTHQAAVIAEDLVRYERVRKKGMSTIITIYIFIFCSTETFFFRICKISHEFWCFKFRTAL